MTTLPEDRPILFFDGVCGLCNGVVDFSIRHDRRGTLLFAPLQGRTASAVLPESDTERLDTVVLIEGDRVSRRSSAVVRLLTNLGGMWKPAAWLLWMIPKPIRDLGYRCVAKLRYRLFGMKESCRLPTPEERTRFLE